MGSICFGIWVLKNIEMRVIVLEMLFSVVGIFFREISRFRTLSYALSICRS